MGLGGQSKILQALPGKYKSVFHVTINALLAARIFAGFVVACREQDREAVSVILKDSLGRIPWKIVVGGATRADSVHNALLAIPAEATHVAIHDAARPLVSSKDVIAVVTRGCETDAAILATPCRYTLKQVSENAVTQTVDRTHLWEAHTPQVFAKALLLEAFEDVNARFATDDASLVEQLGCVVEIVSGDPLNIKVTTPHDLIWLEKLLQDSP